MKSFKYNFLISICILNCTFSLSGIILKYLFFANCSSKKILLLAISNFLYVSSSMFYYYLDLKMEARNPDIFMENNDVELVDNCTCPICHYILNNPKMTSCGHVYCSSCILQPSNMICAVCRKTYDRLLKISFPFKNIIQNLKRKCIYTVSTFEFKIILIQE